MANSQKLKEIFPNASKDFIAQNDNFESQLQSTKQQQIHVQPLDKVLPGKKKSDARTNLVITSFTTRLKDEDNLKGGCKALIDCLRALHLIRDDDPKSIKLNVKQIKVNHRKDEYTRVQITYEGM